MRTKDETRQDVLAKRKMSTQETRKQSICVGNPHKTPHHIFHFVFTEIIKYVHR